MPGQLTAQCLARSRCSLNLSCRGPFQALSTSPSQGLDSGRSGSTTPPADSQRLAESPSTGTLCLPGQSRGDTEGAGVGLCANSRVWVWTLIHVENSDLLRVLLPTEISSVTAQAAEPRVSVP